MWPSCAGPIPTELGALSELQELLLQGNQLSGKGSTKKISTVSSSVESWMDAYALAGHITRNCVFFHVLVDTPLTGKLVVVQPQLLQLAESSQRLGNRS